MDALCGLSTMRGKERKKEKQVLLASAHHGRAYCGLFWRSYDCPHLAECSSSLNKIQHRTVLHRIIYICIVLYSFTVLYRNTFIKKYCYSILNTNNIE